MAEPMALWSMRRVAPNREISLVQNVILSYARMALEAIVERISRIHGKAEELSPRAFSTDLEIPLILSDIVFYQGIASTLLFSIGPRRRQESEVAYESRRERVAYGAARCGDANLVTIKNRNVRNAIARIDEYLADKLTAPETGWFIDMALQRRTEFYHPEVPNVGFCRSYIFAEDRLLHLGEEIQLSALNCCCLARYR